MIQSLETAHFSAIALEQYAEELNRDGVCVIRGLFNPKLIEEWAIAFDHLFQQRRQQPGGVAPRGTGRCYLTLPWVQPFANPLVFANPVIMGILDRIFSQDYRLVQLAADVPMQGSEYQEIHRDFCPLFSDHFVTPLYAVAVNFPLVAVNAENGPFEMARGTHTLPREEALVKVQAGEIPLEQFHMQPGDVMVRSPLALHRGTPNLTLQPRPMIVMGYVRSWLQTEKVGLTLARDYYNSLRPELQQLIRCRVVDQLPNHAVESYINFQY